MTRKLPFLAFVLIVFLSAFLQGCRERTETLFTPRPTLAPLRRETPIRKPGCTVRSSRATPDATLQAAFPPLGEKDWVRGHKDAYVTLVEYGDFQSSACADLVPILEQLEKEFPEDLRIVYRHFPLDRHDKASLATRAAEAAGLQGLFWEMHDLLFERQDDWAGLSVEDFQSWLIERAAELGLDVEKFSSDIASEALQQLAKEAWEKNLTLGMPGTPYLVFNGYPYGGPIDHDNLAAMIKLTLLEQKQFFECPPMTIDPKKQYLAVLHTEKGDITLELFADKAPMAVNSFIFLARQGWFDGITFHRVIPGFVAQAGDPTGTGFGGPGYAFDNEISPGLRFDAPGVLGMANAGPGSNGSQFFITYAAAPQLNGNYTIFGRVVSGMDVLAKLTPRDPSQSIELPPGDKILSVTIIEK